MAEAKKKRHGVYVRNDVLAAILNERRKVTKGRRYDKKVVDKMKVGGSCAVCGESRGIDFCHIIPVSLSKRLKDYQYLGMDSKNGLILCKTHHWCFDQLLLTDQELERVYCGAKEFINTTLLEIANKEILPDPNSPVVIESLDLHVLDKFNRWIKWVARVFFKKEVYGE